jgi:hypothetical protein
MAISEEDPRGIRITGCITNGREKEAESNGNSGNTSILLLTLYHTKLSIPHLMTSTSRPFAIADGETHRQRTLILIHPLSLLRPQNFINQLHHLSFYLRGACSGIIAVDAHIW